MQWLYDKLDEYRSFCAAESTEGQIFDEAFGREFLDKIVSDPRLKEYTWIDAPEEDYKGVGCQVYVLGFPDDSVNVLSENFIALAQELSHEKTIGMYIPLITTTALNPVSPLLGRTCYSTWCAFI